MKKLSLIIICLALTSCTEEKKEKISAVTDVKYCIQNCIKHTFKWFHNKGSSWGTGSSSMKSLGQSQIFDRVKAECVEFYNNEKCCANKISDSLNTIKNWRLHGGGFGVCK